MNSTFLALFPKEKNLSSIKSYRPISLCNSSYNILSKVISNRMNKVILKQSRKSKGDS